jgi:hypothetical protein
VKVTITAHHAHGNTREEVAELLTKNQESSSIESFTGNGMKPMVERSELSLETDTVLDIRNPTWEPEVLSHA